jgi:hypothetical protein
VLQSLVDPYRQAFDLLDRATGLDAAGWADADRPARMSMEEQRLVNLGRLNGVRVARLACAGQGDEAARALLATLRLRRVRPMLPALWTPHSLHALLTFTSPEVSLLQTIQQEYEHAVDEYAVEKRIRQSRAQWLHFTLPGVVSDPPPWNVPSTVNPLGAIVMSLARPMRDHGTVTELREFDEALAAMSQPWPAKIDAATAIAQKYRQTRFPSRRRGFFESLSRPFPSHQAAAGLDGAVRSAAETLARTRASIGAVAVARYSRAHGGSLPASLHDLIPEYLAAPLVDPYTGKELKYLHDATGYKVYGLGINRVDDGGRWDHKSDLQTSRRGEPPDVGIAVGQTAGGAR